MTQAPILETARLRLRPHRLDDFDDYARMWADPLVVRYFGSGFTREASWSRFLRHPGLWQFLGFGFLVIEKRDTGGFVGECGFHEFRRDISPSIEGTMEAGWALAAATHGQGYAEEAMRAFLAWAAIHGIGERLTCIIDPQNAPSLRLAGKLGFSEFARSTHNTNPIVLLERPRWPRTGAVALIDCGS